MATEAKNKRNFRLKVYTSLVVAYLKKQNSDSDLSTPQEVHDEFRDIYRDPHQPMPSVSDIRECLESLAKTNFVPTIYKHRTDVKLDLYVPDTNVFHRFGPIAGKPPL